MYNQTNKEINKKEGFTIIVNDINKTFNKIIDSPNGKGYIVGFKATNRDNSDLWVSTYISDKFIWPIKNITNKNMVSVLLPSHFEYEMRVFNFTTNKQDESYKQTAKQISDLILHKDKLNKVS